MGQFAKNTSVSVASSLEEIRKIVKKYGATKLATIDAENHIGIGFEMNKRRVRFVMILPKPEEVLRQQSKYGKDHGKLQQSEIAYEQEVRTRWRALLLVIRAKLESVQSGIETFDESFMAQIVLPDGHTMAEWAAPQIERAYLSGQMPPLLGNGSN